MNRGQRYATLLMMDCELQKMGSWCGETHLQKAMFVLQEVLEVATGYEFILYKHGPFSFEVRDDLAGMQADALVNLVVRDPAYGPSYLPKKSSEQFLKRFPKTSEQHKFAISIVAGFLRDRGVAELERLATALFIRNRRGSKPVEQRVDELTRLKPHISTADAREATEEIDRFVKEALPHELASN